MEQGQPVIIKCKKCGYEWFPRIKKRQVKCPGCQCRKWDKEAQQTVS